MKLITKEHFSTKELAQMALDARLYQSVCWTLYNCYHDIIYDADIADTSVIIMLADENNNAVGVVFHNEKYRDNYWNTNIQAYVLPEHRGKGYGKLLYKEMNTYLIRNEFNGQLFAGSGVAGSMTFWGKMSEMHSVSSNEFLPLSSNW